MLPKQIGSRSSKRSSGNVLSISEIKLRVMRRQCLDRRMPDREALEREVVAWETRRNRHGRTVDWRFTTEDACIKLQHLYPSF
jgi:hypothetical protein